MQLPRFVGLVDLGVATIVLVTIVLPPRERLASAAQKGSEADQFGLALAEARTMAHPDDGAAVDELSRRLGAAGFKDWAIESAIHGSDRAKESPTRWRALLATSVSYVDRLDVVPALDYANRALSTCEDHQQSCPSWEQIRMKLYQAHLDAGVRSGIDPRKHPKAFRQAGERALPFVRLTTHDTERGSATGPGSGSGDVTPGSDSGSNSAP